MGKTTASTVGRPLAAARSSSASRTRPTGYPLSIIAVPITAIESSTTGAGTTSAVSNAARGASAARRLRINHQTRSALASSTPTAMRRVVREIVDVAIAGGTAGMGAVVGVGVGEGVAVGEAVGVGLADSVGGVAGVTESIGVGTTACVSVGLGVGLGVGLEVASGSTGEGVATGVGTTTAAMAASAARTPGGDRISMPITAARLRRPMLIAARTVALSLECGPVRATVRRKLPPLHLNDEEPIRGSEDFERVDKQSHGSAAESGEGGAAVTGRP